MSATEVEQLEAQQKLAELLVATEQARYDAIKAELDKAEERLRFAYMNEAQIRWDLRMAKKEAL